MKGINNELQIDDRVMATALIIYSMIYDGID